MLSTTVIRRRRARLRDFSALFARLGVALERLRSWDEAVDKTAEEYVRIALHELLMWEADHGDGHYTAVIAQLGLILEDAE